MLTTALKSLDMLNAAIHGLEAIGDIARIGIKRIDAQPALQAIIEVIESIGDGFRGKLDASTVTQSIAKLRASLASNDAAIESELDKKFPR